MKHRTIIMLVGAVAGTFCPAQQPLAPGFLPDRGQFHDQTYGQLQDVR